MQRITRMLLEESLSKLYSAHGSEVEFGIKLDIKNVMEKLQNIIDRYE